MHGCDIVVEGHADELLGKLYPLVQVAAGKYQRLALRCQTLGNHFSHGTSSACDNVQRSAGIAL